MKKLLLGTTLFLLAWADGFPLMTVEAAEVSIGISLPPPIVFAAPPDVVVLPDTDVYVVPDVDEDIYFYDGWWWRPWQGGWYRSGFYDRGWGYYEAVPIFYFDVDPGWRGYYRDHSWHGLRWDYQRISHQRFQQNWKSWQDNRHWEKQGTWGVKGYRPRTEQQREEVRQQRQQQYQQRSEVQRHQQQQQKQERQQQEHQQEQYQQRQQEHQQEGRLQEEHQQRQNRRER